VLEFAIGYLEPAVMAPVERRTSDPFERIFALLAQYREGMVASGCRMGCPIGNLALEVSDSNPEARDLIHRNFQNWASRVAGWLTEAGQRLPKQLDRAQLARFVLTVMEGGLMQARAANDLRPFDEAVAVLRQHLELLRRRTARRRSRAVRRPAGKRRR
jgi:hypothetical protein